MVVLLEGDLGAWEGPLIKMDGMHLSCMPMDCTHKWVTQVHGLHIKNLGEWPWATNQRMASMCFVCMHTMCNMEKQGHKALAYVTKGLAPLPKEAKVNTWGLKEKCAFLFLSLDFGKRHTFSLLSSAKVWPTWLKKDSTSPKCILHLMSLQGWVQVQLSP